MKKILKITVAVTCLVVLCAGLLVGCGEKKPKGEVLEQDTVFYVNSIKTNFINLPDLLWNAIVGLFDKNETYVKLDTQGKLTLNLKLREDVGDSLDSLSKMMETLNMGKIDLSAVSEMDLGHMADIYAAALLPGFTLSEGKVQESVELLRSLNAALVFDWESEEIKKLVASLEATGHANADFSIPRKVEIHYEGDYEIKHLPTIDGEKTIVFTDEYGDNGEPYLLWDLTTDKETGARTVHLRVDFLELDLYATEKVATTE